MQIFFLSFIVFCSGSELTRCCNSGARYFRKTATCSAIPTESAAVTCTRTASICCLRAILDQACDQGTNMAKTEEFCPSNLNQIGGGLRKECCDCCLLAKDLIHRNAECIAPIGFSAYCLRSFNSCCQRKHGISFPLVITSRPDTMHFFGVGDRCATSKCEHLCSDRGGDSVECSCRVGYDLGPDGTSCIDRDECTTSFDGPTMILSTPCEANETCENLPGGYRCYSRNPSMLSDGTRPFQVIEESNLRKRQPYNVVREQRGRRRCERGWTLNEFGACVDVDECTRGLHDCGPLYVCRNTQGSYRCDPKKCAAREVMNPRTGECTHVDCPIGFLPNNGRCEDVNECETVGRCRQYEECINTPGSYRCQEKGNLCTNGYRMDLDTGFCVDINECAEGTHQCDDKQCINLLGTYKCRCSAGYDFNETTMRCEDIDECMKFAGHVCSLHATCENTIGSFECHCKEGFKIAKDGRNCDDIDECELGIAKCAQKCINIPGSYQCICERGYQLGADGITCEDIDECSLWAGSGDELCMGGCTNTPGSYICNCPLGYEIQKDARTCKDIDECERGECQGSDRICVNTLGGFKCHHIECPPNYVQDKQYKNNIEDGYSCLKRCYPHDVICIGNHTREILYQFRALPSMRFVRRPIEVSRIRAQMDTPFSVEYRIDRSNRRKFIVEQDRNIGIVKLVQPLRGPSIEIIRLHINTYSRTHVLLAHNVAIIRVYISNYYF